MLTLVVFIVSLVLLVLLFVVKSLDIFYGRKILLEDLFLKFDAWIAKILHKLSLWWSHVNFKNTKLIFSWIIAKIRKLIINTKRRFDHEQSEFFTKRDYHVSKNKSSVSFFLKDVSDYKKKLRKNREQ